MGRLWNNTIHLEGKFMRTAWQLFIPGKVTVEFFKGKQERYPHPIRLFAIVMFLFLFTLNSMLKNWESKHGGSLFYFNQSENADSIDTDKVGRSSSLYEQMKYNAMLYDMRQDYERLPTEWKTPQAKKAVDSMIQAYQERYGVWQESQTDSIFQGSRDSINLGFNNIQIASLDIIRLDPEEIIERYHYTKWYEQLIVRQGIKSYKTPDALAHAYVGSLTWTILAIVAIMSGILSLLYWRQRRYYVEHFIFLLHFHTGAMLFLLLAILGYQWGIWANNIIRAAAFLPVPAMYFALWRFYGQGWFKTFIKWILYGFLYVFAFAFAFLLGLFVVFAIY